MTITAVANNYSSVNLSQDSILWTLWSLVKQMRNKKMIPSYQNNHSSATYFNDFIFFWYRQK